MDLLTKYGRFISRVQRYCWRSQDKGFRYSYCSLLPVLSSRVHFQVTVPHCGYGSSNRSATMAEVLPLAHSKRPPGRHVNSIFQTSHAMAVIPYDVSLTTNDTVAEGTVSLPTPAQTMKCLLFIIIQVF